MRILRAVLWYLLGACVATFAWVAYAHADACPYLATCTDPRVTPGSAAQCWDTLTPTPDGLGYPIDAVQGLNALQGGNAYVYCIQTPINYHAGQGCSIETVSSGYVRRILDNGDHDPRLAPENAIQIPDDAFNFAATMALQANTGTINASTMLAFTNSTGSTARIGAVPQAVEYDYSNLIIPRTATTYTPRGTTTPLPYQRYTVVTPEGDCSIIPAFIVPLPPPGGGPMKTPEQQQFYRAVATHLMQARAALRVLLGSPTLDARMKYLIVTAMGGLDVTIASLMAMSIDPIDYNYAVATTPVPITLAPIASNGFVSAACANAVNRWQSVLMKATSALAQARNAADKANGAALADDLLWYNRHLHLFDRKVKAAMRLLKQEGLKRHAFASCPTASFPAGSYTVPDISGVEAQSAALAAGVHPIGGVAVRTLLPGAVVQGPYTFPDDFIAQGAGFPVAP